MPVQCSIQHTLSSSICACVSLIDVFCQCADLCLCIQCSFPLCLSRRPIRRTQFVILDILCLTSNKVSFSSCLASADGWNSIGCLGQWSLLITRNLGPSHQSFEFWSFSGSTPLVPRSLGFTLVGQCRHGTSGTSSWISFTLLFTYGLHTPSFLIQYSAVILSIHMVTLEIFSFLKDFWTVFTSFAPVLPKSTLTSV